MSTHVVYVIQMRGCDIMQPPYRDRPRDLLITKYICALQTLLRLYTEVPDINNWGSCSRLKINPRDRKKVRFCHSFDTGGPADFYPGVVQLDAYGITVHTEID